MASVNEEVFVIFNNQRKGGIIIQVPTNSNGTYLVRLILETGNSVLVFRDRHQIESREDNFNTLLDTYWARDCAD